MKMNLKRFNSEFYNDFVSDAIESKFNELLSKKKQINVALSGGSTPIPILEELSKRNIKWSAIHFFLVDERCVLYNSDQCNYSNIQKVFFDKISSKTYPMTLNDDCYEEAAEKYHYLLESLAMESQVPKFDLILLGMGDDGHTASLFPETEALNIENRWAITNDVPKLSSKRITLTYPVLLNAENLWVLVKGDQKINIINNLYSTNPDNYPMLRIVKSYPDLVWLTS